MVKCILTEQGGGGTTSAIQVSHIEMTTPPNKTDYYVGDTFDTTGVQITAYYTLEGVQFSTADVTGSITVIPAVLSLRPTHSSR